MGAPGAPSQQRSLLAVVPDPHHPLLDELLCQHEAVFDTPRGLPPARPYDHHIHLLPETAPVAVRSYRYPQMQKDELEQQCAAMLEQGIIRPSTSPFSAPVLLVKKADGPWCFCIDYRALNNRTSKDKFPIPMVDELLEELHGAKYFTKLDLRSGAADALSRRDEETAALCALSGPSFDLYADIRRATAADPVTATCCSSCRLHL